MLIKIIGAFLAVASFSIVLNMPKHLIVYAGVVGAFSWLMNLYMGELTDNQVIVAFASTLVVTVLSNLFAKLFKSPVTLFLVSGILPSVPGGAIYYTVYYMLSDDAVYSNRYFAETLQIAGAIALAIFLVESMVRIKRK